MAVKTQFELLKERRFAPLFCTQFLGAFNDNLYKNALIILLAFSSQIAIGNQHILINLCAALFIIPYFLFSAFAGQLADKYEKSSLIQMIKIAEIALAVLITAGFAFNNLPLLLGALFLLGTQATFFGPLKYSILPQHLKESELMGGNGLVEMGTFIAILLGTIIGGVLIAIPNTGSIWISIAIGFVALLGWGISTLIPKAEPFTKNLNLDWNLLRQTIQIVKSSTHHRTIFHAIIGISWFWLYGSNFLTQIANYTKETLGGNEYVAIVLLITFSVGIGLGSMLCERLSGRKIETGLVLFGSLGLTLFAVDMSYANSPLPKTQLGAFEFIQYGQNWRILLDSILIGTFGGFYLVPLYAVIQQRSEPEQRSRIIAANNIINAIFMTVASGMAILFLNLGFSIPQFFLVTALLNLVIAIYLCVMVPEFLMRFILWTLISTLYKVNNENLKAIPLNAPALLICKCQNKMQLLVLLAVCRRPVRPVVDPKHFTSLLLKFLFKASKAIPIGNHNPEIQKSLNQKEWVAIFPDLFPVDVPTITAQITTPGITVNMDVISKNLIQTKVMVDAYFMNSKN